jgi:PAS domain S-box-containing protein
MDSLAAVQARAADVDRLVHKELLERLVFETLLTDISAYFVSVPADQVDRIIEESQKGICECLGLDHSSLWQTSPANPGKLVLSHLYRSPELPVPPENMDAAEFFPWALSKLARKEIMCVPDTSKAPPEAARDKQSWEHFGMKSTFGIPLSVGGGPVFGVLSFDSARGPREWPESIQSRLRLIAQVFANAIDRKFSEQKLRESEARLSLAADSAGAGLWSLDTITGQIWGTDVALAHFGVMPGEEFNFARVLSLVHPQDREVVQQAVARALTTDDEIRVEYRVVQADGSEQWMVSRGRRHSHSDDTRHILMGVTIEVTERKRAERERAELAGKLLHAQETEAARIARELHDDLGQSLALLGVQFQSAVQMVEVTSPIAKNAFHEVRNRISEIAHRVSSLSHQLHSSELDYLGLSAAATALCRMVSEQYGVRVQSSSEVSSRLEGDIELCLYRTLQESLNNAVRHGGATGRYRLIPDAQTADLIVAVRKGHAGGPAISNAPIDSRPVVLQPSPGTIYVGGQQGTPPDLTQQGPRPPGPTISHEAGTTEDTFELFRGGVEYPLDGAPMWRYIGKDALDAPQVPAVEAFRKAIAESEKAKKKKP